MLYIYMYTYLRKWTILAFGIQVGWSVTSWIPSTKTTTPAATRHQFVGGDSALKSIHPYISHTSPSWLPKVWCEDTSSSLGHSTITCGLNSPVVTWRSRINLRCIFHTQESLKILRSCHMFWREKCCKNICRIEALRSSTCGFASRNSWWSWWYCW